MLLFILSCYVCSTPSLILPLRCCALYNKYHGVSCKQNFEWIIILNSSAIVKTIAANILKNWYFLSFFVSFWGARDQIQDLLNGRYIVLSLSHTPSSELSFLIKVKAVFLQTCQTFSACSKFPDYLTLFFIYFCDFLN
jgi:hypothetical protein